MVLARACLIHWIGHVPSCLAGALCCILVLVVFLSVVFDHMFEVRVGVGHPVAEEGLALHDALILL